MGDEEREERVDEAEKTGEDKGDHREEKSNGRRETSRQPNFLHN